MFSDFFIHLIFTFFIRIHQVIDPDQKEEMEQVLRTSWKKIRRVQNHQLYTDLQVKRSKNKSAKILRLKTGREIRMKVMTGTKRKRQVKRRKMRIQMQMMKLQIILMEKEVL